VVKRKKNHICISGGNSNDFGMQVGEMKKEDNDNENFVGEEDEEDEDGGEFEPPLKKRKKVFKPLVVMMHNNNESSALSQILEQVSAFGEKNVDARLNVQYDGNNYEIFGEININGNGFVVGSISEGYKDIIKKSIEEGSIIKVELAPLQKVYNQHVYYWLVQFILHRNSSWRTKKLNEFESINRKDD